VLAFADEYTFFAQAVADLDGPLADPHQYEVGPGWGCTRSPFFPDRTQTSSRAASASGHVVFDVAVSRTAFLRRSAAGRCAVWGLRLVQERYISRLRKEAAQAHGGHPVDFGKRAADEEVGYVLIRPER